VSHKDRGAALISVSP